MFRHLNCFLSSVATEGKDKNVLKTLNFFQVIMLCLQKSPKRLSWLLFTIDIFVITIQKHFVYRVNAQSNDFSTELTQNSNILNSWLNIGAFK